ncbi:hypothetical protein ACEWY4_007594 [Coilia grayii]|uniref:CCHC-type domain-containing protein n=1 Tax=Coilia grayii TaxID=363190 RepID=A0ABD1KH50_9TELE
MEQELQELRQLVTQLKADNEELRRQRPARSSDTLPASSADLGAAATERLVFVPRDRKCPMFTGKSGIKVSDWIEEAESCMRARHLSAKDQAFFLFDHLEGEARQEIKYRPSADRNDPEKIKSILQELYGCPHSYVALQEAFFSRKQQDGETLLEFSLALIGLMDKVKTCAPDGLVNAEVLLRDQFSEHVFDGGLRRELKQLIRSKPTITLLELRAEAIRWEREGMPVGTRGRSYSVPSIHGVQYAVHGGSRPVADHPTDRSELSELKDMLRRQQEQLNQLSQSVALLQRPLPRPRSNSIICRRCQQPGHIAQDCDGPRVPARTQPALAGHSRAHGLSSHPTPEN